MTRRHGRSGTQRRRPTACGLFTAALLLGGSIASGAPADDAGAASYYTHRPDDPRAVVLEAAGARPDPAGDDTAAIQKAIDTVQETTGEGVVLVPEGRYRVSATLYVWPGVRLIGFGARRPSLVLRESSPGFDDPKKPRAMLFFAGRRPTDGSPPPDANPGTFYSALANVDVEIGDGNPGAVGVRARYAQHCFTSHVEFRIGSGLTGIHEAGNVTENVRFVGGDYGVWTGPPSPSWQYTMLDPVFVGQRRAAIREHGAGLTLIRPRFRNLPTAIEIEEGRTENLYLKDGRFEDLRGPAVIVSGEESPRTQINLENAVCRSVPTFALFRESGRTLSAPGSAYRVRTLAHGLHYPELGAAGSTKTVFEADPIATLPPPVPSDLPPLPPGDTWVNARSLGVRGDGVTDDTVALQRAIAAHRTVYLPMGHYLITETIVLRPDSVLVGLHPNATQLVIPDRTRAFQGVGAPKPLLEAPRDGSTIVIGVGLSTNGINPRAVGAKWMAGSRSMMNDVRFLGGHGTAGLDGKRLNPYDATRTADPDPARRWDSQYPSLWVTDGGGGSFLGIWTPSSFAQAGLLVSDTTTSGRVYGMSAEHHVRHEVQVLRAANWEFHALQTEAERGESGFALPLEVRDSSDLVFSNLHIYRVISSNQPFPWAVKLSGSRRIRFRGMHSYSNSKVAYDTTVFDADLGQRLRQREFAWLDVSGSASAAPAPTSSILEGGARVEKLADGFHDIAGGAVSPNGDVYFVDARWHRIHRWDAAARRLSTVADAPLAPVNLAFDQAGNLLVVSYAGAGTVYTLDPRRAGDPPRLLLPRPASAQPNLTAILPVGDWRLQRDDRGAPLARPHHYLAPDGRTVLSATQGFVDGETSWGVKSSDLIRAFGLQRARPGERVYLTSEAELTTWSARVEPDGSLADLRLFAHQGGEGVATDVDGRVYLAAGELLVFEPSGQLTETIPVPARPIQLLFGGSDGRTLFVAARDALYAVRTLARGR